LAVQLFDVLLAHPFGRSS